MSAQRSATRAVGFGWVAMIIFTLSYLPAYYALRDHDLFPFLGPFWSWTLTAWTGYLAIVLLLVVIAWLGSGRRMSDEEVRFGPLVPVLLARRTGIPWTDALLLVASVVLARIAHHNPLVFPWVCLLAALSLLSIIAVRVEPWPLHPSRTIPEVPPTAPLDPTEATIGRSWRWDCRSRAGLACEVALRIRTTALQQRNASNPSNQGLATTTAADTIRHLVETGAQDREPAEAARQLLAFARNHRFNYFEEAQNTLQLAQAVPYADDHETKGKEYFRYAIETLGEDAGDCDCKAILASTLFRLMGLRSVVLLSSDEGHAAVAVEGAPDFPGNKYFPWNGARYYFCETTDGSFGFTVGEVPPGIDLATYTMRVEIEPALMGQGPTTSPCP